MAHNLRGQGIKRVKIKHIYIDDIYFLELYKSVLKTRETRNYERGEGHVLGIIERDGSKVCRRDHRVKQSERGASIKPLHKKKP